MKYTWLAIPATLLATIPGLVLGGVAKFIYLAMMGPMLEDGILNWLSDGFIGRLLMAIFPEVIHGAVGGAVGIFIVNKIIKRADYIVVAYSVASLVIVFSLLALVAANQPLASLETVALISNSAGVVIGLFSILQTLSAASSNANMAFNDSDG